MSPLIKTLLRRLNANSSPHPSLERIPGCRFFAPDPNETNRLYCDILNHFVYIMHHRRAYGAHLMGTSYFDANNNFYLQDDAGQGAFELQVRSVPTIRSDGGDHELGERVAYLLSGTLMDYGLQANAKLRLHFESKKELCWDMIVGAMLLCSNGFLDNGQIRGSADARSADVDSMDVSIEMGTREPMEPMEPMESEESVAESAEGGSQRDVMSNKE